jgi:hypothetical protein
MWDPYNSQPYRPPGPITGQLYFYYDKDVAIQYLHVSVLKHYSEVSVVPASRTDTYHTAKAQAGVRCSTANKNFLSITRHKEQSTISP